MELIKLENVTKQYDAIDNVTPISDLNLTINKGDFICFEGPSGTGKSTLLYVLGGLLKATKGKVYYDKKDITNLTEKEMTKFRAEKVGFIFQEYRFIEAMTLKDNLLFTSSLNPNNKISEKEVDEYLKKLNLFDKKFYLPSELSGGQKRRLMILNALIKDPELILADEPTNDLDKEMVDKVISLLEKEAEKGKTIVLVTHNHSTAEKASIRYVMDNGSIEKI